MARSALATRPRPGSAAPSRPTPTPSRSRTADKLADFDNEAFVSALNSTRTARGLNWKDVAQESGVSASTLTRMAQGKRPDVDGLAALLAWSGLAATPFVRSRSPSEPEEPLAKVLTYFRRDPRLSKESAAMLEDLVKAAYERLVKDR